MIEGILFVFAVICIGNQYEDDQCASYVKWSEEKKRYAILVPHYNVYLDRNMRLDDDMMKYFQESR